MFPTSLMADLWYNLINPGLGIFGSFLSSCWPWAGLLLGLGAVGLIGRGLLDKLDDWFEWKEDKQNLLDIQTTFKELQGSGKGAMTFERWRLANQLSDKDINPYSFIMPRDMPAGLSANDYLKQPAGVGPDYYKPLGSPRIPEYPPLKAGLIGRIKNRISKIGSHSETHSVNDGENFEGYRNN